jgi:autophagy-related protein 9
VYEAIREHDAGSDSSDVEERAGLAHEGDYREHFSDGELADELADAVRSEAPSPSAGLLGPSSSGKAAARRGLPSHTRRRKPSRPRWMTQPSPPGYELDDRDEDVPPSLLVEGLDDEELKSRLPPPPHSMPSRSRTPSPPPPPQAQPDRLRRQTRQTGNMAGAASTHPVARWFIAQQHPSLSNTDPKKKAMWRWANVENLDNFLKDVYTYFLGNGFWSILLSRTLNLLYAEFLALFPSALRCGRPPKANKVFQDLCFRGRFHDFLD